MIDRKTENILLNHKNKKDFILACYEMIVDNFNKHSHTYLFHPHKNMFIRNMMNFKSLPCHMYALLLRRCLKKKLPKDEIQVATVSRFPRYPWIHFFLKVDIDGQWVDVDAWGKKRGIPFGKNAKNCPHE